VDPPQLGCCEVGGRMEIALLVLVGPVVSHLPTHPRERELVSRRGDVRQLTERSPTNRLLPNVDAVVDAFSEAARIAQVVPILLEDDSIVLFVVVAVVEGCQDTQLLLALLTHAPSHAADDTSSVIQGSSREKWTHARVHRAANVDDVGGGERAAWVDVARHDPLVP